MKVINDLLKKAKYEFFKDIEKLGGIFENAGAKQERYLRSVKNDLMYHHSFNGCDLDFIKCNKICKEIDDLINFFWYYSKSDKEALKEARRFITRYDKNISGN